MNFKSNIAILGASGFVGKNLFRTLSECSLEPSGFERPFFDLTQPNTFPNFRKDDVSIVDAIATIDDPSLLYKTNVEGFRKFLQYLVNNQVDCNYIYFSTTSTTNADLVKTNAYVQSKFAAEGLLRSMLPHYKIIRLTYPFGTFAKTNRLLPRLFHKICQGGRVEVNDVALSFTPIEMLCNAFCRLVRSEEKEINYVCSPSVPLKEVVSIMQTTVADIKAGKVERFDLYDDFHCLIQKETLTEADIKLALRYHFVLLFEQLVHANN